MSESRERLPERIAIIGNTGRMGAMLEKRAKLAGFAVLGADLPLEDEDIARSCSDADLVILCVPARHLEEVIIKVTPHLKKEAILSDITSVKEAPMRQMRKHWSGAIIGSHPLFGPRIEADGDLPVALVKDENAPEAAGIKMENFITALGFRPFYTDAETHDKAMAKIQNMNFITNLAYFAALAGEKDLVPFLTPSFERRKKAAQKMLTEDAEMFAGLFEANPHSHESVRQFRRILNLAASGDVDLLCQRAQWWWPGNGTSPQSGDTQACQR